MSAGPNVKRAFDHPGLFMVRLGRLRTMPAAEETLALSTHERPARARQATTVRRKHGTGHRYCSSCRHETEHAVLPGRGPANIPTIRWPAAEPASGTTICLSCGQWRGAASEASPPAWSSWPRQPIRQSPGAASRKLTSTPASRMRLPRPRRRTRGCRQGGSHRVRGRSFQRAQPAEPASRGWGATRGVRRF